MEDFDIHAVAPGMEPGAISMGGMITGPIKPPFSHPEWQGSVPAKWMDRGSGYLRGKPLHSSDIRDGYNGIARKGLGHYGTDVHFRRYEESLRRTKQFPDMDHHIAPWGDHPQEMRWKPSRRKLEDHEFVFRVGPKTCHAGLLAHVSEPNLLTKRPAFIDKKGTNALPVFDGEIDRQKQKAIQKQLVKRQKAAADEDRWERAQVLDLESWERSHVQRGPHLHGSPPKASLSSYLADKTAMRKPRHSQSETGLQFMRQRL